MSELALKLIAENKAKHARGEDARVLDLGNCGLTEVPEMVGELVWLEELKIGINKMEFLEDKVYPSESYDDGVKLALVLSICPQIKIPGIPTLKKVVIGKYSGIINLEFLTNLTSLKILICQSTMLRDLHGIEKLLSLQNLDISNTFVDDFSLLKHLVKLRVLKCSRSFIENIDFLKYLSLLQNLYLNHTYIQDIQAIKYSRNLRRIDLQFSSELKDISPLAELDKLREVNIYYTAVEDLSPLEKIINRGKEITRKYSKNAINIRGCKIQTPPPEVIKQGNAAIVNWFSERSKTQFQNTEIKLILIGNSTAGKTSLSRYLRESAYEQGQYTTHGVQNHRWQVPEMNDLDTFKWKPQNQDIEVNIWDFGGQEYYHATHRLFLSRNAVYALVWDAKTEQGGIEPTEIYYENDPQAYAVPLEHFPKAWWLKNIHFNLNQYARHEREGDSPIPVLLVQNKCATGAGYEMQDVPNEFGHAPFHLPAKWRNHHIDIAEAANEQANGEQGEWTMRFKLFETELLKTLEKQMAHYEFAIYHRDIRDRVRALASGDNPVNEMSWTEFEEICRDIEPDAKMDLVQIYLRDITGDILYFNKNERLRRRVFLRPDWVCNRIYAILSRKVLEREGLFDLSWVQEALQCEESEALDFVELMREFQLVFAENDESGAPTGNYVAPQYLPDTCTNSGELEGAKKYANLAHAFTLWFPDFLPKSHIARFVAHWGGQAKQRLFWKNGLLFQTGGCTALVERVEEFKVRVDIQEVDTVRRASAMARIFQSFLELEDGQAGFAVSLNAKDFVWWPDAQEAIHTRAQQMKTYPPEAATYADVQPFMAFQKPVNMAKKVFISYSKHDRQDYLEPMLRYLSPLVRGGWLTPWDDSHILPGEEWDDRIKQEIERADVILLLVSTNSLNTDYIWNVEIEAAMRRHEARTAWVVPVILSKCLWAEKDRSGEYIFPPAKLNALPAKGKPVSEWERREEAWDEVAEGVKRICTARKG